MSDTTAATPSSRTAVVAVALDLFDRNGFDATSVEQIAQAAGSSRSTFFRQFGGKDDVVFVDLPEVGSVTEFIESDSSKYLLTLY